MSKKQTEEKLKNTIAKYGYWSDEVFELNNQICKEHGEAYMQELNNKLR